MMGLGTFGIGGSSSPSSNLSALAPPFSVDRSSFKPNANPPMNVSEPPYALPFHSSFPNWQYSHHPSASGPDFYPTHGSEVDSIRTTCLPSGDIPNPNSSVAINPNFSGASHKFSFLQHSSDIPSNHVGDKPFYPPFVSPVIDDDNVPLVALNESSYDLLSTSCAPLDRSIRVNYTDLEYLPQLNSSWNRLSDLEQGKRDEPNGSFCFQEKNIAGSFVYNNYMVQEDTSAESQIVSPSKGKLHDKVHNPWFISGDSSRTSISGSSTLPQSHAQGPFPTPAAIFWNNQISYDVSYDKCFQPLESCTNDFLSVKKSSPPLVIRPPPPVGTSSTVPNTDDEKNIGKVAAVNGNGFGFHDSPNQKVPRLHVQRTNQYFVASSSTGKEETGNKAVTKDVLGNISKCGMQFQFSDTNVPNDFAFANDSAEKSFTSVEDSHETFDSGTSVDSPCWKGASASCFSLPEVSEACTGLNLQQTQSFPPSTSDAMKAYEENGYVEFGSVLCSGKKLNSNCPIGEHSLSDDAKARFSNKKLSSSEEVQFYNDVKPRKEYGLYTDSKSCLDLKPGHTKELGLEKHEVTAETEFRLYTGLHTIDASEDFYMPLHGMGSTSRVPCSAIIDHKLVKVDVIESSPEMNVQTMVDTIHHLSELLLFYWSRDVSAASQKDHEAIKHAINNLDACVSKEIPHMTPTQESRFPPRGTSRQHSLHKGVTAARSSVTKEANASSDGHLDHHVYEGNKNKNSSGKKVEICRDFVSLRDDAEIMKDDKIVQAIKELLKEDFIGEEEIQSETLLYKNLWLEAEAALCSTSYKARFNRMKIEMEKHKSDKVKDVETLDAVERVPSSKVSPDLYITRKVTPEAKDNLMSDIPIQDSSISTMTNIVDDVATSVMARLDILKRRDQSSNRVNAQGQQLTEVVDARFADNINHFPFSGDRSEYGRLNASDESHSQNSGGNSKIDDFGPYISSCIVSSDDQAVGSGRKNRMGSGMISGWHDSSSSDWEHVLKNEFPGQN